MADFVVDFIKFKEETNNNKNLNNKDIITINTDNNEIITKLKNEFLITGLSESIEDYVEY